MLIISGVSAGYGRANIIHDLDLEVKKGELVAIIGGNGAGKTTTMRTISGMIAPTTGRISIGGEDVTGLPSHTIAAHRLAHTPEGRKTFASLSVLDNLRLGAFSRKAATKKAIKRSLAEVLEMFPRLAERIDQTAGTLSGGEQQMLAIGRSLMADPAILLLDEPSLGLAPKLVDDVYTIVRRLKQRGTTMLLVEQFANIALSVADRAYVMENGRITLSGQARELLDDQRVRDAYIGSGHEESAMF
jgi:branched-chain amino acid transport system ATP-binding protein